MEKRAKLLIALVALAIAGGTVYFSTSVVRATSKPNNVQVYGKPSNIDAKAGTFTINSPTKVVRNVSTAATGDSNKGPFKVVTTANTRFVAGGKKGDKDNDGDETKAATNANAKLISAEEKGDQDNDNDNDNDEHHGKGISKAAFFSALKPTATVNVVGALESGTITATRIAMVTSKQGKDHDDDDDDGD
jgi:hypothetical protein